MISSTADELFRGSAGVDRLRALPAGGVDLDLWDKIVELGFPLLGIPEEDGGAGGSVAYLCSVVRAAGRHLALVPLVEVATASWLAHESSVRAPRDGIVTIAVRPDVNGGTVTAHRVPFARHATTLVLLEDDRMGIADADNTTVTAGLNLADEPRDRTSVSEREVLWSPARGVGDRARNRLALLRSAAILGVLEATEAAVVKHVREREQFGAPLARLPVVRERLALIAEAVALARAAVENARREVVIHERALGAGASKIVTSRAAATVAQIAHQLHGAIGVTSEHPLHLYTRRMLAWRDEDGTELDWGRRTGRMLLDGGGAALWRDIVEISSPEAPP